MVEYRPTLDDQNEQRMAACESGLGFLVVRAAKVSGARIACLHQGRSASSARGEGQSTMHPAPASSIKTHATKPFERSFKTTGSLFDSPRGQRLGIAARWARGKQDQ